MSYEWGAMGGQCKRHLIQSNCQSAAMFRMIFGDFDFDGLSATNRVLGPLLFVFFFVFVGLTLLVCFEELFNFWFSFLQNMFIAVLSDIYIQAEKRNEATWEILISRLKTEVSFSNPIISFKQDILTHGRATSYDKVVHFIVWLKGKIENKKVPESAYLEMGSLDGAASLVVDETTDEILETQVVFNDAQIDQLILDAQKDRTEIATINIYKEVKSTYVQMQLLHKELREDVESIKKLLQTLVPTQ